MDELYWFGFKLTAFCLGGVWIWLLLQLGIKWAVCFVRDEKYQWPKVLQWINKRFGLAGDGGLLAAFFFFSALVIVAGALLWPLVLVVFSGYFLLLSLRWANRVGRYLGKLGKAAHKHATTENEPLDDLGPI